MSNIMNIACKNNLPSMMFLLYQLSPSPTAPFNAFDVYNIQNATSCLKKVEREFLGLEFKIIMAAGFVLNLRSQAELYFWDFSGWGKYCFDKGTNFIRNH